MEVDPWWHFQCGCRTCGGPKRLRPGALPWAQVKLGCPREVRREWPPAHSQIYSLPGLGSSLSSCRSLVNPPILESFLLAIASPPTFENVVGRK